MRMTDKLVRALFLVLILSFVSLGCSKKPKKTKPGSTTSSSSGTLSTSTSVTATEFGFAKVTVSLNAVKTSAVTFTYKTNAGTATAGQDYISISSATGTIPAGQLSTDIYLSILNDFGDESNETFSFKLVSASGASLGTATTTSVTITDQESSAVTGVYPQISVGYSHACALTNTGDLKCWGTNGDSFLLGSTDTFLITNKAIAISGITNVAKVVAGHRSSCVLYTNGSVQCWGNNMSGQLGNNGPIHIASATPVNVVGLNANVTDLAGAGGSHFCVVQSGAVKCWGDNTSGALGDNSGTSQGAPVTVAGVTATSVATGYNYTCAIIAVTGAVKCWGQNNYGQLGDGTLVDSPVPVDVPGLSGVTQIASSDYSTCALLNTGAVKCWGYNVSGQVGDGTTTDQPTPTDVSGLSSGVASLDGKNLMMCALLSTGGLKCWGENGYGQLGNGTFTAPLVPVNVSGLTSGVLSFSVGSFGSCATLSAGGIKCWGSYLGPLLGNGIESFADRPVDLSGFATTVSAVSIGWKHTCSLLSNGGVQCFGINSDGQLGDGTTVSRTTPSYVSGLSSGVSKIASAESSNCAILNTGALKCWGDNSSGQLGDGTTNDRSAPVQVSGLTSGVSEVAVGGEFACAIVSGAVKCWGANYAGQLGDGSNTDSSVPVSVAGISTAVKLGAGYYHACAVLGDASVKCWGTNSSGQLGDGTLVDRNSPVSVSGLNNAAEVKLGFDHTCARLTDSTIQCWGYNSSGQLGDGTTNDSLTPVVVSGLTGVSSLVVGFNHGCALTSSGPVKCWGDNSYAYRDGTSTSHSTPYTMPSLSGGFSKITSYGDRSCVIDLRGYVKCWGTIGDSTASAIQYTSPSVLRSVVE